MTELIPPLDYQQRLPPLLACLSTSYASPLPPPALLPLLSPLLGQRVRLISNPSSDSGYGSWLPLLCWNPAKEMQIGGVVEDAQLEPHPVSGEIELQEPPRITYRRVDYETLYARAIMEDLKLKVIYVWCEKDDESEACWRIHEVSTYDVGDEDGPPDFWHPTVNSAERWNRYCIRDYILNEDGEYVENKNDDDDDDGDGGDGDEDDEDDDDSYWRQYDNTPARTPAPVRSPIATPAAANGTSRRTSEDEYYAQYKDVQPALDKDDAGRQTQVASPPTAGNGRESDRTASPPLPGRIMRESIPGPREAKHDHSRESISTSRNSSPHSSIVRLESLAITQSHAEFGVKQHICTSIKSLYRLARAAGIEREDFERAVRTQMDLLELMDEDD
ncbi:MAG: hypothetical protein M1825_002324 [Sarcosagium campestre]|nr:MAG: hypothetical protein M1825_002324 [Sarcosagium campestre]